MYSRVSLLFVALAVVSAVNVHYGQWSLLAEDVDNDDYLVTPVKLTVALKLSNMDALEDFLLRVSSPKSSSYGKYMTRNEVAELIAPTPKAIKTVLTFFADNNIPHYLSEDRDFISIYPTLAQASQLFEANLARFTHPSGITMVRSTSGYTVPAEIADYVSCIAGLTGFPRVLPNVFPYVYVAAGIPEPKLGDTSYTVTPAQIREMYSVTVPDENSKNLQAVVSFLEQWFNHDDLQLFFSYYEPSMVGEEPVCVGENDDLVVGIEATLDIQYLMGVTENIATWVYYTDGYSDNNNEPWLDWFSTLESETTRVPYVFSMSYQDYEPTVDEDYASSVNDQFMKYSASGYTFVTGSGDWGVGCDLDVCDYFSPDFPSSSPYVVSLGGTTFDVYGNELGVYFSSGGFSDYFTRPSYQDTIVPTSYFNTQGRGFPDLSTISTGFWIVASGSNRTVGGTSAATPTFASMVSLINSMRLASGLSTMGWINPFLYEAYASGAYTDITDNEAQDSGCCDEAFSATTGWDPMTGMGVPKFDVLASLALDSSFCNFN